MRLHMPSVDKESATQPISKDEFDTLLKRAELGSTDAISELRELMLRDRKTWAPFGDLTEHVKQLFLAIMAKENVIVRESLDIRLNEFADELRRGESSPMRKLIVDSVILSWLDHHYCLTLSTESSDNKTYADRLECRAARAQTRYFRALDFLCRIDKLEASES